MPRRRELLAGLALGLVGCAHASGAAAAVPAVLRTPALQTPRAQGAAILAVTRAGKRLVAAGERGTVLLSDDAGRTWRQASVPVQVSLAALRFVDERTGWAAGHLGVVLRTDDGGASWTRQLDGVQAAALALAAARTAGDERALKRAQQLVDDGPDKAFFDIDFADARRGVAVGAYGLAFATDDGGANWRPLGARLPNPKGLHLYGVKIAGERIFVAGEQGLLLRSDDGGASFATLASPYKGSWFGLVATRDGALFAYGLRGNVFRSLDLGASWQPMDSGGTASISAGVELPDGRVALLDQNGDVLLLRPGETRALRQRAAEPVPATGLAVAFDGGLSIASLRGLRRRAEA